MSQPIVSTEAPTSPEPQDIPAGGDQISRITNKGNGDVWKITVSTSEDGILHGKNEGEGVLRQLAVTVFKGYVKLRCSDQRNRRQTVANLFGRL